MAIAASKAESVAQCNVSNHQWQSSVQIHQINGNVYSTVADCGSCGLYAAVFYLVTSISCQYFLSLNDING
jgi:transcription elongation factor Elf1